MDKGSFYINISLLVQWKVYSYVENHVSLSSHVVLMQFTYYLVEHASTMYWKCAVNYLGTLTMHPFQCIFFLVHSAFVPKAPMQSVPMNFAPYSHQLTHMF